MCFLAFWAGRLLHRPARRLGMPRGPEMLVIFPDVADGDCVVVRDPTTNRTVLIDAGQDDQSANQIVASLDRNDIDHVDALILAGSQQRSLGGLSSLLAQIQIRGPILLPCDPKAFAGGGRSARSALHAIDQHGLRAWETERYLAHFPDPFGANSRIQLTVLPVPSALPSIASSAAPHALAVRLDYGGSGVLDTAALTPDEEDRLLVAQVAGNRSLLACDVLAVADGGSASAASSEFLAVAAPRVATIASSSEHQPAPETLQRLHAVGAEVGQAWLLHSFSLRLSRFPEQPIIWSEAPTQPPQQASGVH